MFQVGRQNIKIHGPSYCNKKSEEDFYFKENELNNLMRKENNMSIIELWEKEVLKRLIRKLKLN